MKLFSQKGSLREIVVPAEKKISTPAGQRLSHIMDTRAPPVPPRSFLRNKNLADVDESSTSSVLGGKNGFYSNAWSDGGIFRKDATLEALRSNRHIAKRGGWWRLALIVAIVIAAIIALALGLVFGLRKTKNDSSDRSSSSSSAAADSPNSSSNGSNQNSSGSNSTSTTSADFPLGTYSFTTFLDTVTTDCTSNEATWTCPPYTIYNSNKAKSAMTFNWIITGSEGNYKISSTDNPLALEFEDVDLEMVSKGQDSERYHFQFTMDKKVIPSTSITDDDSSAVCFFNSTIFTGYLYTKMEKDYPTSEDDESNTPWPYAVRAEQSIGGGEDVPNCYKTENGRITEQITDGLNATDASTLCSCLYRNYLTK
ncbi:hypothetical protein B0J12DRAFT_30314 [Macrophomina phaseolina]|uniref:Tat pathway signal sequence n=1 Tax=Macrophomina phaseolina TaxID=35725 RepID=A0ABQ8GVK7_9PEZI|nr:hypothetical protein B0J12DRAFT_30314 [Macrophomina phaseolina]